MFNIMFDNNKRERKIALFFKNMDWIIHKHLIV